MVELLATSVRRVFVLFGIVLFGVAVSACAPEPEPQPALPPVQGVSAVAGDGSVSLSWSPIAGESVTYRVESSATPEGPFESLGSDAATQRTVTGLANDQIVWFRVVALSGDGRTSKPGVPVSAVPAKVPLAAPVESVVEPGRDVTVVAGEFSATVPAGSVSQPTTITVTPLAPVEGSLPAVDVHIHGEWDASAGGVKVSLPFPFATIAHPLVLHETNGETVLYSGVGVEVAGVGEQRRVSVKLDSLSPTISAPSVCGGFTMVNLCVANNKTTNALAQEALERLLRNRLAEQASGPCGEATGMSAAVGASHSAMKCTAMSETGVFEFRNISPNGPVVVKTTLTGAPASTSSTESDVWFLRSMSERAGDGYVFPSASTAVTKTLHPSETQATFATDTTKTIQAGSLMIVNDLFFGGLLDQRVLSSVGVAGTVATCLNGPDEEAARCFMTKLVPLAQTMFNEMAKIGSTKLASDLAKTNKVLAASLAIHDVARLVDRAAQAESVTTSLIHSYTAGPPVHPARWIARNPDTGRSRLVGASGAGPQVILTGEVFECLAKVYPVWDIPNIYELRYPAARTPASCENVTPYAPWVAKPDVANSVGRRVILRNSDGSAWHINFRGEIQTILDEGTYLCMARNLPVYWNVAQEDVEAWRPVSDKPASCGESVVVRGQIEPYPGCYYIPGSSLSAPTHIELGSDGWISLRTKSCGLAASIFGAEAPHGGPNFVPPTGSQCYFDLETQSGTVVKRFGPLFRVGIPDNVDGLLAHTQGEDYISAWQVRCEPR